MGTRSRSLLILAALFICLYGLCTPAHALQLEPEGVTVLFPCRFSLPAKILDLIKRDLEKSIRRKTLLQVYPVTSATLLPAWSAGTCLLLEDGFPRPSATEGWRPASCSIMLGWGLVVRADVLASPGIRLGSDRDQFLQTLRRTKEQHPERFPWFEALFSEQSLLSLRKALGADTLANGGAASADRSAGEDWHTGGVMRFLQGALDAKLLNPLSIEADENLAFEVLDAGDAACSTLWAPLWAFDSPERGRDIMASAVMIPFPQPPAAVPVVPTVLFRLWTREPGLSGAGEARVASTTADGRRHLVPVDVHFDLEWIRTRFSPLYDRLIMGDF